MGTSALSVNQTVRQLATVTSSRLVQNSIHFCESGQFFKISAHRPSAIALSAQRLEPQSYRERKARTNDFAFLLSAIIEEPRVERFHGALIGEFLLELLHLSLHLGDRVRTEIQHTIHSTAYCIALQHISAHQSIKSKSK